MDTMLILGDGALGRAVEAETLRTRRADTRRPARTVRLIGRPVGERHDPARPRRREPDRRGIARRRRRRQSDRCPGGRLPGLRHRHHRLGRGPVARRGTRRQPRRRRRSRHPTSASGSCCSAGWWRLPSTCSARSTPSTRTWSSGTAGRSAIGHPGTAADLTRRIVARHPRLGAADDLEVVSLRAGESPGMHLVGFDATGETIELRLTARDRSPYAAGILAAADWLERDPARARPARLRPHRRRAHRSRPDRCLKGTPMTPTFRQTQTETSDSRPTRPMLRGAFTALVTPFTDRRRARRGRIPPPRPLADPGRDRRPRPVRDDRRIPHPVEPRSASG